MRIIEEMAEDRFQRIAWRTAAVVGSHRAFLAAGLVVLLWAVTGPLFGFSDSWQLVINTGTTVITFLMVFIIQATQNRDSRAIHLKLDELIRSHHGARNTFTELEHATDEELERFEAEFQRLRARLRARQAGTSRPDETPRERGGMAHGHSCGSR